MSVEITLTLVFYLALFIVESWIAKKIVQTTRRGKTLVIKGKINSLEINYIYAFLVFLFVIIFVLVVSQRSLKVGTDTIPYENMYNYIIRNNLFIYNVSVDGLNYNYEFLYSVIVNLSNILFHSFRGFLGLMAAIEILFILTFCIDSYNEFEIPISWMMFTFFIFIFGPSLNIIRQVVALSIVFYGIKYIYRSEFIKYFICVLIASLFHISALITIIFYIIYKLGTKLSKNLYLLMSGLFIALPFVYRIIISVLDYIPYFHKYISLYSVSDFTYSHLMYSLINLVLRVPFIIFIMIDHKKLYQSNRKNRFLTTLYCLEIGCFILSIWYHWTFRMAYYCMYSDIILIPELIRINSSEKKKQGFNSIILVVCLILFFCLTVGYWRYDGIVPYSIL